MRSAFALGDAGPKPPAIEQPVGDIHDLRMHAVLRVKQSDALRLSLQPFEHRMRETACADNGRKLMIVANQHESSGAEDQSERERFSQLSGFVDNRHLKCARTQGTESSMRDAPSRQQL